MVIVLVTSFLYINSFFFSLLTDFLISSDNPRVFRCCILFCSFFRGRCNISVSMLRNWFSLAILSNYIQVSQNVTFRQVSSFCNYSPTQYFWKTKVHGNELWLVWLVCMNATRLSRRSSGRFVEWKAKRAFTKRRSLLSTYLNRTGSLNLSMCLFIWVRLTRLAHLTALARFCVHVTNFRTLFTW